MSRLVIEVRALAVNVGYRVRPYDMTLDRRRWVWQPRGACGRQAWAGLPADVRDELIRAVRDAGGDI